MPAATQRSLVESLDDVAITVDEFDLAADDVRTVDGDFDLRNVAHVPMVARRTRTDKVGTAVRSSALWIQQLKFVRDRLVQWGGGT